MYTKLFKAATLPPNLSAKYVPLFLLANAVEFLKQILCYLLYIICLTLLRIEPKT